MHKVIAFLDLRSVALAEGGKFAEEEREEKDREQRVQCQSPNSTKHTHDCAKGLGSAPHQGFLGRLIFLGAGKNPFAQGRKFLRIIQGGL